MPVTSRWRGGAIALPVALAVLLAAPPIPGASQPAAPPVPAIIDTRDAPALGPDTARVTIVEFADFQCPFCARSAAALRKLLHIYPDRVRWVFKHFPLRTAHPGAALAHEAAIAAEEQGKFWEMHELIFRTRPGSGTEPWPRRGLGLDMPSSRALETRSTGRR
jgi:protein-disulfide isomerase